MNAQPTTDRVADSTTASALTRHLTSLTEALTARLDNETTAFLEHRAQDVAAGLAQTQEMANQYRRETAQIKANRSLIAAAPMSDRTALITATQTFEAVLARHGLAVEAARVISEGLVQAIAQEVSAARAQGTGYGATGRAAHSDGRAVTFNRTA